MYANATSEHVITEIRCPKWTTNAQSEVSFQWWFVLVLVHTVCIMHCGEVDCDEDTDWGQSQWEGKRGGRQRGTTKDKKVKWKTSLPLPLGLISFGPPLSSPSNHHYQPQSACVSSSFMSCDSKSAFSKDKTGNEKVKRRWMSKKEFQILPRHCMFSTAEHFMSVVAHLIYKKGYLLKVLKVWIKQNGLFNSKRQRECGI